MANRRRSRDSDAPASVVEPVEKVQETLRGQELGGAEVKVGVELVDDGFVSDLARWRGIGWLRIGAEGGVVGLSIVVTRTVSASRQLVAGSRR